jgi:hypothetical protein
MGTDNRRKTLFAAAFLLILNIVLVRRLFVTEYLDQMGSIEGAYIGISRYLLGNWRDLSWFPLWYGGIPFRNTYPPLLHAIVAMVAAGLRISPALAHHAVTALFYSLGSVTVFWLAYRLANDWRPALLTGALYSAVSPSAFLVSAIRHDLGSVWYPRRFEALVHYGEGPHLTSLMLLALAIALLHRALERRRPVDYALTTLASAAVALSNYLGLFSLVAMTMCYLLARGKLKRDLPPVLLTGLASYALAAPWIPPSTLAAVRINAQRIGGPYTIGLPQVAALLGGLALLAAAASLLRQHSLALRFWILASLVFGGITLSAMWFGFYVIPQPERYHLQMEMALLGLTGVALAWLAERGPVLRWAVYAVVAILCVYGALKFRRYARREIRPIAIESTVEHRIARWLEQNTPGERTFVHGSVYFWLNAFSSQPQLSGGFDQGLTNQLLPGLSFQVYSGMNAGEREGEIAVALLKAFGVQTVSVGGPKSREFYKVYRNARKFDGLLEEIWREGDDAIYRIPQRSPSLAHVMRRSDLVEKPPAYLTQVETLRPYLAALDNPAYPLAQMRWSRPGAFTISAGLQPDQLLSIQETYDAGWKAETNGRPVPLRADGLGQMVAEPACSGPCSVAFEYTGGLEMRLAILAQWITLLGGAIWLHRTYGRVYPPGT